MGDASEHEARMFDAQVILDRLLRDAEQLRASGHLPGAARTVDVPRWADTDDAAGLAARVRAALGAGDAPLGTPDFGQVVRDLEVTDR